MIKKNISKPFIATEAKVLIVDDSIVTLKVEEDLMKTYGMNVSTATSGEECIKLLSTNKYDIIFMDHIMPNMDGIETTLSIRKLEGDYFKNVVIIALTSTIFQNSNFMYIQNGFNDFLEKPIDIYKLNIILKTYLPRKYILKDTNLETTTIRNFDEVKIKNVDTKKAIQNCFGNINNYLSLLSVAYHDGKNKVNVIKNYADNEDIENYIIEVHSLKTVAALIGDNKLSKLAKLHEIAAKNSDLKFILDNVDYLITSYNDLLNNIKPILPKENAAKNMKIKSFTTDTLLSLIDDTAYAIDNFDLDLARESLERLLDYNLSNSQISVLNRVQSYMNIFDYDNAYELIINFKYALYSEIV